jgi:hypothetical protein
MNQVSMQKLQKWQKGNRTTANFLFFSFAKMDHSYRKANWNWNSLLLNQFNSCKNGKTKVRTTVNDLRQTDGQTTQ